MESIHLASTEIYSILSAILWLIIGVVIMRYGNRIRMEKGQSDGKAVSFWGLVMFVNAALVVYIPDIMLAWMIAIVLFLISLIILLIYQYKQQKCK